MANEAILKDRLVNPLNMTIGDLAIEKGTLMQLSIDPRTVQPSSGGDVFGGVAARERISGSGEASIACFFGGVFDLTIHGDSSGITQGAQVALSGVNLIKAAIAADLLIGAAFGTALETGSASEIIHVRLN